MESATCLSSCSVVLRYLVSSAGVIHGEFPLRRKSLQEIKIIGPSQFLYLVFLDGFSKSAPFALGGRVKKGVRTKSAPLLRKHIFLL